MVIPSFILTLIDVNNGQNISCETEIKLSLKYDMTYLKQGKFYLTTIWNNCSMMRKGGEHSDWMKRLIKDTSGYGQRALPLIFGNLTLIGHGPEAGFNFTLESALLPGPRFQPASSRWLSWFMRFFNLFAHLFFTLKIGIMCF